MLSETESVYELWEEEPPVFPHHSRLYSLEPIGIGSLMAESLTSYISRLAEEHSVYPRVLLTDEIAPLLQQSPISSEGHVTYAHLTTFWTRSAVLNGNCPTTSNCVQALEQLTLRNDLRFLTLLPFMNIISKRKLLRRIQAWCPVCYEQWREANVPIYDPLFWSLECVTMCAKHGQELQQHCPYKDCARSFSPLSPKAQPGYCPWCKRWLGYVSTECLRSSTVSQEEWKQQQWVQTMLGELFTEIPHISDLSHRDGFVATITAYTTNGMKGNLAATARQFHINDRTLQEWLRRMYLPQLQNLLPICSHLGISLLSLLTGKAVEEVQSRESQRNFIKEKPQTAPRKFDAKRIQHALEETLNASEYPPPSMRDVARNLRYHPAHLSRRFPELCRAISQRYLAYLTDQSQQRVQRTREKLQQTMYALHAQGRYPSARQVTKLLGGVLKEATIYATWQETLKELGWK